MMHLLFLRAHNLFDATLISLAITSLTQLEYKLQVNYALKRTVLKCMFFSILKLFVMGFFPFLNEEMFQTNTVWFSCRMIFSYRTTCTW